MLATGLLIRGATTYPNAVVTYNPVMDASDVGTNPGIELWPDAAAEAAGVGRLSRSNDDNGQWNYRVDSVFSFAGNLYVLGATSPGSAVFTPSVWTTWGSGMFLIRSVGFEL